MTVPIAWRAILLALFLCISTVSTLLAHGLPNTVLMFTQQNQQLRLTISLPLEDLVIAAPRLQKLETAPLNQNLGVDALTELAGYFSRHLTLSQSSGPIALSLQRARIEMDENEHIGTYRLLTLTFGSKQGATTTPLTLIYDAVMHEVRNHRAAVYWAPVGDAPVGLAEFGFKPVGGGQRPVLLQRP